MDSHKEVFKSNARYVRNIQLLQFLALPLLKHVAKDNPMSFYREAINYTKSDLYDLMGELDLEFLKNFYKDNWVWTEGSFKDFVYKHALYGSDLATTVGKMTKERGAKNIVEFFAGAGIPSITAAYLGVQGEIIALDTIRLCNKPGIALSEKLNTNVKHLQKSIFNHEPKNKNGLYVISNHASCCNTEEKAVDLVAKWC